MTQWSSQSAYPSNAKFFLPTVFVIPAIVIHYSEILSITVARSTLCIAYTILYLVYIVYTDYCTLWTRSYLQVQVYYFKLIPTYWCGAPVDGRLRISSTYVKTFNQIIILFCICIMYMYNVYHLLYHIMHYTIHYIYTYTEKYEIYTLHIYYTIIALDVYTVYFICK